MVSIEVDYIRYSTEKLEFSRTSAHTSPKMDIPIVKKFIEGK